MKISVPRTFLIILSVVAALYLGCLVVTLFFPEDPEDRVFDAAFKMLMRIMLSVVAAPLAIFEGSIGKVLQAIVFIANTARIELFRFIEDLRHIFPRWFYDFVRLHWRALLDVLGWLLAPVVSGMWWLLFRASIPLSALAVYRLVRKFV